METMTMKLTDFGLARAYEVSSTPYTREVVTLWYRAPELLLGQKVYSTCVDIWSMGCIFSEMATSRPLFPGDSEIDTLFRIFRRLGTPNEKAWPMVNDLPDFRGKRFPQWVGTRFTDACWEASSLGPMGIDLLSLCLIYKPEKRPHVRRLAQHAFFKEVQENTIDNGVEH